MSCPLGSIFSSGKLSRDTHSGRASLRSPSDKAILLKLCHQIELIALNGRAKLAGEQVSAVLQY